MSAGNNLFRSLFLQIQVDPYLEDALCSNCSLRQGPYFCREMSCFKYYCRSCWDSERKYHNLLFENRYYDQTQLVQLKLFFPFSDAMETMRHHKPIMRNSRNNSSSSRSSNNNNNGGNPQPHTISHQKTREITLLPQISPPHPSGVENHY